MSVIGGQNTPSLNGLAYIIDFNNNYTSGSSTVNPILYLPTSSQFTGSVPNLVNGQVQFTGSSVLRSFQNFPGFNPNTGNLTIMFSGEVKNNAVLFTQDAQMAVVGTTSSIGYGVPAGNVGRNFPNTGFDHVTLRFSSASVDCFVNGLPVSASGIFPTVPSSSTFTDFKIGGNYLTSWTGSLSGSLGQLMVYTRPLSDDEIYSNYLIQARRYGLSEAPKPYTVDSSVYVYSQAAGITDTVTLNALNTFVQGLKSASLWDKMVAIYPFIGTNPSASRLNLKDVSLNTTQVNYSGSWSTSLSGSRNNNTSSFGVLSNITPSYVYPLINSQSFHMTYLSYDTPISGGYAMGTLAMATGGEIIVSGSRVYHVYKTTGTSSFTPFSSRLSNVEVMVVGGGGSGGANAGRGGGGGGAGGLVYSSSFSITPGTALSVVVGNGGVNSSGENSVFGSITAIGGGRGGSNSNGVNGGSGGGAGSQGFYNSGSGTVGQGNDGGGTDSNAGGGGGGAGSKGLDGVDFSSSPASGSGGSGSFYPQFASLGGSPSGWFAGGGGGGLRDELSAGRLGGPGGGGQGGSQVTTAGNGVANTGGGGGGANWNRTTIGSGGSGIVIVSYSLPNYQYSGSGHSIYISPTEISASLSSDPSAGFTTGGPIGMITVSRTGSSNFTISKNKVPTTITARASSSISSAIFLNGVNINNTSSLPIQNTVAYSSVGSGLTPTEITTYYDLVDTLQSNLGRKNFPTSSFITVWNTLLTGSGTSNSSSIVLPLFGTQAITASWGDGTTSLISQSTQVDRTHSYATPGIYTVSITGTSDGLGFGDAGDKTKLLDIVQWGTSKTNYNGYAGCSNLIGTFPDVPTYNTNAFGLGFLFRNATRFNGFLNNWNMSTVNAVDYMFSNASSFNQPLNNWNLSSVGNMYAMFQNATSFNQSVAGWNLANVNDMGDVFRGATSFNQPLSTWTIGTSSAFRMSSMFQGATLFNQNIGSWNVTKVNDMNSMFLSATAFNNSGSNTINNWRPISCSAFNSMFQSATAFNQPIGNWPISASNVNMFRMFYDATTFNQNIGSWDVSKVTNMSGMFLNSTAFNNSGSNTINNWRPISCSNFSAMFQSATSFNQPIGNWPISASNINMSIMFYNAVAFNQNIGAWNTSAVIDMSFMFSGDNVPVSCKFNQNIGSWNTSLVTNMSNMFAYNNAFNQDIGSWNTSAVTNMGGMFQSAAAFNNSGSSNINNWNTSAVTNMRDMFFNASSFNQDIGSWNVGSVTNMLRMFEGALAFNQNIGSWNVSSITGTGLFNFMEGKSSSNYSFLHTIYDGWINNKLQPRVTASFGTIKYSGSAAQGRALLTRAYNTGSITGYFDDGGNLGITCSVNHNVVFGNTVFISGSSSSLLNGAKTVLVAGTPTTLTFSIPYDPTATGGDIITGYGWSITDGGVV